MSATMQWTSAASQVPEGQHYRFGMAVACNQDMGCINSTHDVNATEAEMPHHSLKLLMLTL